MVEQPEEQEAHRSQRERDARNPPRSAVCVVLASEVVAPVPERGDPDLLRALHDTCTEHPHLRRRTGLFTEVETEESEGARGRDGVCPGRTVGDALARIVQGRDGVWQADEEERDAEEDPRDGQDVHGGLETKHRVPHSRRSEEDTADDVELSVVLPVRAAEQSDLETGGTEHLKIR